MKKDKEKKDVGLAESVVRLLDFVESHGGIAKVARTMGVTTQVFYNYRNGLSKPDTISYYAKVGRERVEKEVKWDSM